MSSSATATATAHSFNKILNQSRASSKSRHAGDVDEGIKKLRRLILVDGIPSTVVSFLLNKCVLMVNICLLFHSRILCYARGFGKYCYACMTYRRRHSCSMFHEDPARSGKKYEMILSGMPHLPVSRSLSDSAEMSNQHSSY